MEDCQRKRRAAYHRQKLAQDPAYKDQCRESKKKWRDAHTTYMGRYRAGVAGDSHRAVEILKRLLGSVKNNLAVRVNNCAADVWMLVQDERVKNILASAKLIVVEVNPAVKPEDREREHLLGPSPPIDV